MVHHSDVSASADPADLRIARLAAARHGLFSREQAFALGASRGLIQRRLTTGRWERIHEAVYRLAGAPPTWRQRLLGACLVGGEGCLASRRSGAAVWGMPGGAEQALEIGVPSGRRVRRPGIVSFELARLIPADREVVDAIPITSPTRTLIELAAVVEADVLEEALDDVLRRGLTSVRRLRWRLDELGTRGRRGSGVLEDLLRARMNGAVPQSVLETKLLRLLRRAGLPSPVRQHPIRHRGRLVAIPDFAYPSLKLAVEADGYRWHSSRARWSHDLARRNLLTALGWRVIHVIWSDLRDRPDDVVRIIVDALQAAGALPRRSR